MKTCKKCGKKTDMPFHTCSGQENHRNLQVGDRFRFGSRTVWEIKEVVKRGVVMSMLDGSHKRLLNWEYINSCSGEKIS